LNSVHMASVPCIVFPPHERLQEKDATQVGHALGPSSLLSLKAPHEYQSERPRAVKNDIMKRMKYYPAMFSEPGIPWDKLRNLSDFNSGSLRGQGFGLFVGEQRVSHEAATKLRPARWSDLGVQDAGIVVESPCAHQASTAPEEPCTNGCDW